MYKKANGCSIETFFALAIADTVRRGGFHSGIRLSNSKSNSRSQYVSVPHSNGISIIRISDHKRPESASEKYGKLIADINTRNPLNIEIEAVKRAISILDKEESKSPPELLPAGFCGRVD